MLKKHKYDNIYQTDGYYMYAICQKKLLKEKIMNFLVTALAIGTINSNVALNNQISSKIEEHNAMVQEKVEEGIKYFNEHLEKGKEYLEQHSEEGKEYLEQHMEEGKEYLEQHAEEGKEYFEQHMEEGKKFLEDNWEKGFDRLDKETNSKLGTRLKGVYNKFKDTFQKLFK